MNSIIAMFSDIAYPVWIKNRENEIVFTNDAFKLNLNLDNRGTNSKNEIENLFSNIKKLDCKSTQLITLENKIYNHVTFPFKKEDIMIGILQDLSNILETPNIQYEKHILRTVIDNIPELIFYKDKELKYVGINKEFEKFYENMGVTDIIGKCDYDLPIDKSFAKKYSEEDEKVITSKQPIYIEETGNNHTFETVKTPIISSDGTVEGIVGVVRDITAYKWKEGILKQLCYTDALTNLFNRTYFDEKIDQLIKNESYPIGLILGDVNGLKIVNDTLGHIEGDKLLKKMSELLKDACKEDGTVFRWGGDEFIILLPNCSDLQCALLMQKIDGLCSKTQWGNINLSISQGYATLQEGGSIDKVLAEAENKVYKQKMLSGNTVRASILDALKINLENKNVETEMHTDRVANYCMKMAKELKLDEDMIEKAGIVGKLHDIGKIGISDHILLKPGKLTPEEYEIMKTHSEKGYRLASLLPEISPISREILTHHERWDGEGYPLGLRGDEIPILSRIVSIADSFDAMTEDRCYSKGRSIEEAVIEIKRCSGTQFDPELVKVFIDIIDKIKTA